LKGSGVKRACSAAGRDTKLIPEEKVSGVYDVREIAILEESAISVFRPSWYIPAPN
jgi:hypothetical protein